MTNIELTFTDKLGGLLVIMPSVLDKLLGYRQLDLLSNEAAGVLIGERRESHIVVHEISEPGEGDIRRRSFVDRRGPHHQATVDDAFVRSRGQLQYLGEWHTHPEDQPSPSATDLGSWRRYLVSQEQMVVIIVGRKEIWAAKKITEQIVPLLKI
ncbi:MULTISPECIES: Mov34/MPN/PAD-1 family protein [Aeromonas]|uniref:CBASS system CD-NTase/cGAS isopeptidase Cap3 n=2 Tax=Aeromonas TaxID=642 RepID=UPI0009BCD397|nr:MULTISPECIES: Mov34/MPN/PAD-1 family protein [Aeromonas]MCJ8234689.1 Mov34/MPN/PAD-1 family protein [Aeromonas veronii]QWZ65432.1 Mov34/MPN/PAD-1 family protein [Aeromonas sp. FDAARGOS 1417]